LDPVWGRSATIFTGSLLLAVAGSVGAHFNSSRLTWAIYFSSIILVFLPLYFYTRWAFPFPVSDQAGITSGSPQRFPFVEMLRGYFALPALFPGLGYLFFMRSGETVLSKMGLAFLMDSPGAGGYGLTITEVGVFTGVMTSLGITGGAIAGI